MHIRNVCANETTRFPTKSYNKLYNIIIPQISLNNLVSVSNVAQNHVWSDFKSKSATENWLEIKIFKPFNVKSHPTDCLQCCQWRRLMYFIFQPCRIDLLGLLLLFFVCIFFCLDITFSLFGVSDIFACFVIYVSLYHSAAR